MKKILVTGGCGYIGGHTIVDLIQNGFDVISVDDLSRGSLKMLKGIEQITRLTSATLMIPRLYS
jgi:UDP-glucose 4-epimerase